MLNRFRLRSSRETFTGRCGDRKRRPAQKYTRPLVERLEERTLLSTAPLSVGITGAPATAPEGSAVALGSTVSDPTSVSYTWRAGRHEPGSALWFDGFDDFVEINRQIQDDFTIEAWINTTSSLNGSQFYQGTGLIYADVPFWNHDFGTALLNGRFAFGTGFPDQTVISSTPVTTGEWVHVAAVRIRATGTIKVFVNGVEEGSLVTGITAPLTAPAKITIGGNTIDSRYFRGMIDEVRLWNVARDEASIQADMNRTLLGTEQGLTAYYRFDEGTGTIANDQTASDNGGSLGRGVWWAQPAWVSSVAPLQESVALATGSGSDFTFTPNDNGNYVVSLQAVGDGGNGRAAILLGATNVNPTAQLVSITPIREGNPAALRLDALDPSIDDTEAGLTYSFDFNNDGDFTDPDEVNGSLYAVTDIPLGLLADGPSSLIVHGQVWDKDGGFTDVTATFLVENVAPTATLTNSGPVDEGSSATVSFSNVFDSSDEDVFTGFIFSYDFDNDGVFEITDSVLASAVVPAHFLADGPFALTVRGRVQDDDGGFTDYTTMVLVNNINPTVALLGAPESGIEGTAIHLGSSVADPGADTFAYAWEVTRDGIEFASGSGTDFSFLPDDNGSYVVRLTVTDDDGGSATASAAILVDNLAPLATMTGPSGGVRGQTRSFMFSASDASAVDQADEFTYTIDWGDGSEPQTLTGPGAGLVVEHVFTQAGAYSVQVTATDKDGHASAVTSHALPISVIALQPDPFNPKRTNLVVGGTLGNDDIFFRPGRTRGSVRVVMNGVTVGVFQPTGGIVAFGQDGNDALRVASGFCISAWLEGGAGNDFLKGAAGNDFLIGGPGRDWLIGGRGRDVIVADEDDGYVANRKDKVKPLSEAAIDVTFAEWQTQSAPAPASTKPSKSPCPPKATKGGNKGSDHKKATKGGGSCKVQ